MHLHLPGFKAPRHTDRSLTLIDFQTWKVPTWLYNTPGFNVTPLATQGSLSSAFVADWYSHNETITLVAQTHLPACTPGSLTFLPRNQLSLPTLGLAPNDPRLRISIDAARMGRVNETAVPVSDGVGYFTTKLLDVQPQSPGAVVRVNLTFSLNADLKELEAVSVVLPGFYGCSNNSLALGGKHATLFDGHWLDESDTWQLVARQHVRNGTAVSVSLLPSNLVHFAKDGLIELPTISTNASLGPVRVPVAMNATRLGHFLTSEVSVSEASTDPNVTLGLRFRYNTAILPGTAFFLSFTGLRANLSLPDGNASSLWLSGANASAFGGLISQPDGTGGAVVFTLLATAGFAPGALVNLTLANSLGLRLPLTGLREADPRLTLWTNSTLAPMPAPETVAFSPPVGLFFSSLTFRTPQAGQRSAVDLALSASGRLHRGDRIRLRMPGFNSSARVLEAEPIGFTPGGPSGRFFLATWDPTIDTLALEVGCCHRPNTTTLGSFVLKGLTVYSGLSFSGSGRWWWMRWGPCVRTWCCPTASASRCRPTARRAAAPSSRCRPTPWSWACCETCRSRTCSRSARRARPRCASTPPCRARRRRCAWACGSPWPCGPASASRSRSRASRRGLTWPIWRWTRPRPS